MIQDYKFNHPLFSLNNQIIFEINKNIQFNLQCLIKLIKCIPGYNLKHLFTVLEEKQKSKTIANLIAAKYNNCKYNDNIVELLEEIFDGLVDCDYYIIDTLYSVYGMTLVQHHNLDKNLNSKIYEKYTHVGLEFTSPARQLEGIKFSCNIDEKLEFIIVAIMSEMLEIIDRINFEDSIEYLYNYLDYNLQFVDIDIKEITATDILIKIISYNKLEVYDKCFNEVHTANLNKRVFNEETNKYEYIFQDINGVKKIMKPPGFVPPNNKHNIINWLKEIDFKF